MVENGHHIKGDNAAIDDSGDDDSKESWERWRVTSNIYNSNT